MSADFQIQGVDPLLSQLHTLERRDAGKALRTATRKAANHVRKEARSGAPVVTGNYKKSLRVKTLKLRAGEAAAVKVGPVGKGGAHGHLIELGTGDRVQKTTQRKTGRMPAMGHLSKTYARSQAQAEKVFRDEVAAAVNKVR